MKKLLTSMRIALRALRVNRTRSALTMLGIIIGVGGRDCDGRRRLGRDRAHPGSRSRASAAT